MARADALNLFTQISYSGTDNSPPPADAMAVYDSVLDVRGLADGPSAVIASIPRESGSLNVEVGLDQFDRREGYMDRDPEGCSLGGVPGACDQIPIPGLPANMFSYTWAGHGGGYFLRLTVHRGFATGVIWGPSGRFEIRWNQVRELRISYFRDDEAFDTSLSPPTGALGYEQLRVLSDSEIQRGLLAQIAPRQPAGAGVVELDVLLLITDAARVRAGGNPSDCRDTAGIMAQIYQRIGDTNSAFANSQIPARLGVTTVSRLYGYTLIPHNGDDQNTRINLANITLNPNIRSFRNAVGADVVSVLFDTQTNLGPCGVANTQRHGCTWPTPTASCDVGGQFSEWTTSLDTIECSAVQISTHELGHVLGAEHHFTTSGIPRTVASFPYSYGYGYSDPAFGFETIMSQRYYSDPLHYPVRLLQFSNPNRSYNGRPTGSALAADNAHTLSDLIPTTAAFRTRPQLIFSSGFDEQIACPGITY